MRNARGAVDPGSAPIFKSINTGFEGGSGSGIIGKLRGCNDLNATSQRSSADLLSLSSFLRSSSAFSLSGLRTGSQVPRSRPRFSIGGLV
jgi:hypothetical protein